MRRNSTGNREILVFRGQTPCTRVILRVLLSFLHLLKAKDVNNFLI